jgi:hypothetical protein
MVHFVTAFAPFLFGIWLHLLMKIRDYKSVAELNPDPNVKYDLKEFISKELLNYAILISSGIAMILYFPGFFSGHQVEIKNGEGKIIAEMGADLFRAPLYFLTGMSGSTAVLGIFGKYKKVLFKQVLPDDDQLKPKP